MDNITTTEKSNEIMTAEMQQLLEDLRMEQQEQM